MPRVLVVEDSPVQAKHLEFLLRAAGHEPVVVSDGLAALESIRSDAPDLVLTDVHMPRMSGLELAATLRTEYPALPVIITTDRGSEDLAVQALRGGAAGYLPKRNLARDISPLVDEVLAVTASQQQRIESFSHLAAVEYVFKLDNNPDSNGQIVSHAESIMRQLELFDEATRMRIGMAIHEATVNAIVHGNLGVSSALKDADWAAYLEQIESRATIEPYCRRRVTVIVRASREPANLEVRVQDQGEGYNPDTLPDPTDPANLDRSCGRGLLLIRTFFDEVSHTANGTEIIMRKRATPAE